MSNRGSPAASAASRKAGVDDHAIANLRRRVTHHDVLILRGQVAQTELGAKNLHHPMRNLGLCRIIQCEMLANRIVIPMLFLGKLSSLQRLSFDLQQSRIL